MWFFSAELFSSLLKIKKTLGGLGACSPGKFWKFTCCSNHFSTFLAIFRQILFIISFLPLNLGVSPNVMYFVRTFLIMLCVLRA